MMLEEKEKVDFCHLISKKYLAVSLEILNDYDDNGLSKKAQWVVSMIGFLVFLNIAALSNQQRKEIML